MENSSFQTELVSIMEVLAKAAAAEISRRVDDSCALLRLEVTQSQHDIFLLKKKCEGIEAELRRSRIRAKKKDVSNKEGRTVSWSRASAMEQIQALQRVDLPSGSQADVLPIKEEGMEDGAWSNDHQDQSFDTSSTEICSPLAKDILNKEVDMVSWGRESTLEQIQALQRVDLESGDQGDVLPIKQEGMEDDVWNDGHQDPSTRDKPLISDDFPEDYQAESLGAFPLLPGEQQHQQLIHDQLAAKREESNKALAAAVGSASVFLQDEEEEEEEAERPWVPADCSPSDVDSGDPGFSYRATRPQYAQSPSLFKNSLPAIRYVSVDLGMPVHSAAKLHSASRLTVARAKRRARNLSYKRLQQAHMAAQGGAHHSSSSLQLVQQQQQQRQQQQQQQQQQHYREVAAELLNVSQGTSAAGAAGSHPGFCSSSRGNVALAKARMRALSWRSGSVGDKRFCCTYCDKSFVRFCQLEEHLRRHTGERPFSCLQCGRSFTKQCNLIRHAVVHSGEKPHQCSTCGKCFTQRSSLKSHQKTAH